jgi:hypothetical protein
MTHIAIIGAGQLGSRHLQGLSGVDRAIQISVLDPAPASLERAKVRFQEMPANEYIKSISFFESLIALKSDVDVAIVATHADVRRDVVEELLEHVSVRFLILEKVAFQSVEDFQDVIDLLEKKGIKAWVNCTARMYPFYKTLKQKLRSRGKLYMNVTGGNWGLASNSIHMLDLFAFLTGENKIFLDGSDIDSNVLESKREGFIELTENLRGRTKSGSKISLMDCKDSKTPSVIIISNADSVSIIMDGSSKALQSKKGSNSEWEEVSFQVPLQSQLTCIAIQQILDTGKSDLPTLEESFTIHKPMLETFNQHLEEYTGRHYERVPIT